MRPLSVCFESNHCSALLPALHSCLQVLHAPTKCKAALVHLQVGAGVLGLPSAMSYLGWPGGIIVLVLSCTTLLLACVSLSRATQSSARASEGSRHRDGMAGNTPSPLTTSCSHGVLRCAEGRSTERCALDVQGSSACTPCGSSASCTRLMGSASIDTMSWHRCPLDLPARPLHSLPVSMLALSTHHHELRAGVRST